MKKEKIINKLLKQAKQVTRVDISQKNIKKLNLNDFHEQKGDLYYFDNTFYKKGGNEWFMTKIDDSEEENEQNKQIIQELVKWCKDFKKYVDSELRKMKQEQDEGLRELKEYVDDKFEELKQEQDEGLRELKEYVDNKLKS